jgi:hypothetical protein
MGPTGMPHIGASGGEVASLTLLASSAALASSGSGWLASVTLLPSLSLVDGADEQAEKIARANKGQGQEQVRRILAPKVP